MDGWTPGTTWDSTTQEVGYILSRTGYDPATGEWTMTRYEAVWPIHSGHEVIAAALEKLAAELRAIAELLPDAT